MYLFHFHFCLKAVSILAEWASSGKIKLSEFETNPKFLKLCRMLGKETTKVKNNLFSDLSTVLGITGDDEAAKLISSISLPQMVKVNLFIKHILLYGCLYKHITIHDKLNKRYYRLLVLRKNVQQL